MACGERHTACLDAVGNVWTFGSNHVGQLGLSCERDECTVPQQITELRNITFVSCGSYHTICVGSSGFVWSFGSNEFGQLGIGTRRNQKTPQQIGTLTNIVFACCGRNHTLCTDSDGSIYSFGYNIHGELGIGPVSAQSTPQTVKNLPPICSIACGKHHTFVTSFQGDIYCFGSSKYGQLGLGDHRIHYEPMKMISETNFKSVCCGEDFTVFLSDTGTVYTCGSNTMGQLGIPKTTERSLTPIPVPQLPKIEFISSGYAHTMCVDEKGSLWTFGSNHNGQLGIGKGNKKSAAKEISQFDKAVALSRGGKVSFIRTADDIVYTFGNNKHGQLGQGDTEERFLPTECASAFSQFLPRSMCKCIAKSARK